jgi:hypothetical protein
LFLAFLGRSLLFCQSVQFSSVQFSSVQFSSVYLISSHHHHPPPTFTPTNVLRFANGITARVVMAAPATAVSWTVYEFFKHALPTETMNSSKDCPL